MNSSGRNINLDIEILYSALDLCTELVQIESADGVLLYVNEAWCDYFGEKRDKVMGVKLNHLNDGECRINELGAFKGAHTDAGNTDSCSKAPRSDWIDYFRIPFKTYDGNVTAYITAYWPATAPKGYISVLVDEPQFISSLMRYKQKTDKTTGITNEQTGFPENLNPVKTVSRLSNTILTNRELEVLMQLSKGLSNIEVANELVISVSTVKTHVNNIFKKLKVTHRTQAIARYGQMNMI